MPNLKKIVPILIMLIAFTSLILIVYFTLKYIYTMPPNPQPEVGRINPFNYGKTVYLTKHEDLQLKYLFVIMLISIFIRAIYNFLFEKSKQS